MNILIVEDDEFKAADLVKAVEEIECPFEAVRAASVTSALREISSRAYDICLLDMSLPTFDLSGPGGGGSPQSQGGVEILRLAKRLTRPPAFIIVTQYPDIEISGRDVPLSDASTTLCLQYEVNVLECLLYDFDAVGWRLPLQSHLRGVAERVMN